MNREHEAYQVLLKMAKAIDENGIKAKRIVYYPEKQNGGLSCLTGLHVSSAIRKRGIDAVKYNGQLLTVRCGEKRGLNGALELAFLELKIPNVLKLCDMPNEKVNPQNAFDTILKLVRATANDGCHIYSYYPTGGDVEYKDALAVIGMLNAKNYDLLEYGGQYFIIRSLEKRDMAGGLAFASMQVSFPKSIVLIDDKYTVGETKEFKEPVTAV